MMKLFVFAVLSAATSETVSAFTNSNTPISPRPRHDEALSPTTSTTELHIGLGGLGGGNDDIWSRLQSLEGPSICYGPEGILIGKPELEIKEYDNFDLFRDALAQTGVAKILKQSGEKYTLLAPVNSGILAFPEYLDEEILNYHIIKGEMFSDEFDGQLETMNGAKITARYEFRKPIADDAFIGQKDNHTYGTKYPTDIICDNGIIHAIKHVLVPGYKAPKQFRPEVNKGDRENNLMGGAGNL